MKRIGTIGRRLTTLERLAQIHDIYNPEIAGDFDKGLGMSYEEIQKRMINTKDYICPPGFDFRDDKMKIGKKFAKYMVINDFPKFVSDRLLTDLSDMLFNVIVTVNIHPLNMTDGMKLINKQILGMEANKQEGQKNAIKNGYSPDMINHNLKDNLDDAEDLRNGVTNENEKLFEVTFNILVFGDSEEELNENTESIKAMVNKHICRLLIPHYLQEEGLNQTLPFGHADKIDRKRTIPSSGSAAFLPFISQELMHSNGFYYGLNAISNNLIYFNRLNLMNANGFILGTSGSGKSFSAKREMANILLNTDDEVIVIDPDGEYVPFAKGLNGEHIIISPTSNSHINPFDMEADYTAIDDDFKNRSNPIIIKSDFLISVCETAISANNPEFNINPIQRSLLDKCILQVYQKYVSSGYDKKLVPTFKDLQRIMRQQEKQDMQDLADSLEIFTEGSLSVFANRTNVDIKKRFVVFDISKIGTNLDAMGSLIMLDAVWNHVLQNRKKGIRTWLYVDEFTVLLRRERSKVFFLDTFKRIRKMGGACTGITQNITSLYNDDQAMEMLANAEFIYLLNQSPSDQLPLSQILNMSNTQLEHVSDAQKGHGLIKAGRNLVPFKDDFPKNTELYRIMTTDPEERKVIDKTNNKRVAGQGKSL